MNYSTRVKYIDPLCRRSLSGESRLRSLRSLAEYYHTHLTESAGGEQRCTWPRHATRASSQGTFLSLSKVACLIFKLLKKNRLGFVRRVALATCTSCTARLGVRTEAAVAPFRIHRGCPLFHPQPAFYQDCPVWQDGLSHGCTRATNLQEP